MKRKTRIYLGVLLIGLLVLSGCGEDSQSIPTNQQSGKAALTFVTSFYPMYLFTLNITKDIPNVEVVNLTKTSSGGLHDYAVTPQDLKTLEKAQVFIINGAGLETFMDKVMNQIPDLKIIEASKGIPLIEGPGDEGFNPHVWVSIANAITEVETISEQLALLDPEHAAKYKENAEAYIQKLIEEKAKMQQALEKVDNRNVITFHNAFPYFAQEFKLNIVGVIEREPGSEPSAREFDETIDKIKSLKIKALFAEPQYSTKAAETIAKETGAKVYTLDPVVTGPMDPNAYTDIMERNLKTLEEALR